MKDLKEIRKEINQIDEEMLKLFEKRMDVVNDVALYKKENNIPILDIKITKHIDGSITIDHANYTPIYMYKDNNLTIKKMKVLDIEKTLQAYDSGDDTSIGSSNYKYLQEQLDKIKKIVGEEF